VTVYTSPPLLVLRPISHQLRHFLRVFLLAARAGMVLPGRSLFDLSVREFKRFQALAPRRLGKSQKPPGLAGRNGRQYYFGPRSPVCERNPENKPVTAEKKSHK
jgi:hypothetical protein